MIPCIAHILAKRTSIRSRKKLSGILVEHYHHDRRAERKDGAREQRGLSTIRFLILCHDYCPSTTVTVLVRQPHQCIMRLNAFPFAYPRVAKPEFCCVADSVNIRHVTECSCRGGTTTRQKRNKESSSPPASKPVQISLRSGSHGSNKRGKRRFGLDKI